MSENLRECCHKEILLSRFIVRDANNNFEFAMCKKCWGRIEHLKGYILVECSFRKLQTHAEKIKELKDVPF
jgi:hypothetical protein